LAGGSGRGRRADRAFRDLFSQFLQRRTRWRRDGAGSMNPAATLEYQIEIGFLGRRAWRACEKSSLSRGWTLAGNLPWNRRRGLAAKPAPPAGGHGHDPGRAAGKMRFKRCHAHGCGRDRQAADALQDLQRRRGVCGGTEVDRGAHSGGRGEWRGECAFPGQRQFRNDGPRRRGILYLRVVVKPQ